MTFKKPINWIFIFGFYIIAFVLSLPFNSGYFSEQFNTITKDTVFYGIAFLPACLGTTIAALLAYKFDKSTHRTITFWGSNKIQNTVITFVPLLIFTLSGLPNDLHLNPHNYAFVISIIILIYSFGEEVFWRGYMINALEPLSKISGILLLGILWWAWHFPFTSTFGFTTFLPIVLVSSFLIGKFVESTKSFLTAASIHSFVVIMNVAQNSQRALITGGITVLVWLAIGKLWKPKIEQQ